ncbi:MAG: hypothetical protein EBR07_01410 [Planctomycetes bacterium]|nr:hypothetical protein [Planctomycetota bacterium]
MTDLEEAWENPQGDIPAELPVQKPRRRTYNWRELETLQMVVRDLREENDTLRIDLLEARHRIANQAQTIASEHATAEHAVADMWAQRRVVADRASGAVVAYVVIGALSIIAWEMLAHLVAAVTR